MRVRCPVLGAVGRPWLAAWSTLLGLAVLLTLLVAGDLLPDEAGVIRTIQRWGFPGDPVSNAVHAVTGTQFVAGAAVASAAFLTLLRRPRSAVLLLVLLGCLVAAQSGIKDLIDRPRPAAFGIEARTAYHSPSFPSGHVMSPVAVYTWMLVLLWQSARAGGGGGRGATPGRTAGRPYSAITSRASAIAPRAAAVFLGVVLIVTGPANVYLGVHWPTDVAGGYLWGLVLALPALRLERWLAPRT